MNFLMSTFKGTALGQTSRFKDKDRELAKSAGWAPVYDQRVDIRAVNLDIIGSWLHQRITELMGQEDDIVIDYALQQLKEASSNSQPLCPKQLQINLTGFLEAKAPTFVEELWGLLVSASKDPNGIPYELRD